MNDRIKAIEQMIETSGEDVFLRYSLGMEYAGAGEHARAVESFRKCIELEGDYLPAYVEAGKSLRAAGDSAGAREMFTAGMELAAVRGERHVRDFIQQQLDALPKA